MPSWYSEARSGRAALTNLALQSAEDWLYKRLPFRASHHGQMLCRNGNGTTPSNTGGEGEGGGPKDEAQGALPGWAAANVGRDGSQEHPSAQRYN